MSGQVTQVLAHLRRSSRAVQADVVDLQRLERQGLIKSKWGASRLNRRARFYELTRAGKAKLTAETSKWERMVRAIGRVLQHPNQEET